jgi:hypothetical protein
MTANESTLDWVNLPPDAVAESLWVFLHDGQLLSVRSDLLQRTVDLEIDVPHIREHLQLGNEVRFILRLQAVESVRVTTWSVWPGPPPEVDGKPIEEQNRLITEYKAKWREESASWNDFEATFLSNKLDIYQAEIARQKSSVALQIVGSLNGEEFDDQFFRIFIRAGQTAIEQNNGIMGSIEHFLEMGKNYWESF